MGKRKSSLKICLSGVAGLLLLVGLSTMIVQSAPALAMNNSASQEPLTSIRMLDNLNGWALTATRILKTTDGGVDWQNVTPAQTSIVPTANADFMNTNYAWVVSTDTAGNVVVLSTKNGGASWQTAQIADSNNPDLTDMPHFLNINDGWLSFSTMYGMSSGVLADIYNTTDGGLHWSKLSSYSQIAPGLLINGASTGISLKDTNDIWYTEAPATSSDATGEPIVDQVVASVSHDGGQTWQAQQLPTIPGISNVSYTTTPPVFIGQKGMMPVYVQSQNVNGMSLYISNDGGTTWNPTQFTQFAPNQVQVIDAQHIYADTIDGQVFASSDSGLSWQQLHSTGVIGDIDMLDNTNGSFITATSSQYLLRTSDGGQSWQKINYVIQN